MSENSENNLLSSLMERLEQEPDAIIISSVVRSRDLPGAERMVGDIIRDELSIPVPSIETTLPLENIEKVDYQIRAFIEINAY